jgi:hypothetical protein
MNALKYTNMYDVYNNFVTESLEDTVKTHEQMFDQSSVYRQQIGGI